MMKLDYVFDIYTTFEMYGQSEEHVVIVVK